jgi:uridine kinase
MEAPLPRMEDKTGKEAAVAELVLHDEEVEEELAECRCVRPLVVGIAGASRSGKTTLALGLLGALGGPTPAPNSTTSLFESFDPRTIVHLDRYFKSVMPPSIHLTSFYYYNYLQS